MRALLKKLLRLAGYVLGAVVVLAGILAAYVQIDGIPKYPHETPQLTIVSTPASVARGKRLASMLCNECHLSSETNQLTGKHLTELPEEFGDVYSKNITRHPEMGVGKWTDGELAYFLRTGVRPDGQYVPPWMVKLPHLSDDDLGAIISFLRSDDPVVAPSPAPPLGTTKPSFLAKALAHGVFGPLPYPSERIPTPPLSDRVAYGRYLTVALDCFSCHSADFKTMNIMEPEKTPGYLGGGNTLQDAEKKAIHSANLTPDDETGIGRWTEEDFARAVTTGVRPDGRVLHYPMLPKTELEPDEVGAIYAYLRTVPKIHNAVERPAAVLATTAAAGSHPGKRIYQKYGCGSCHGENGIGLVGDLRGANEHFANDAALRAWIEDAPRQKPGTKMPPWKGVIRDEDYAPLMSYVRTLARPGKSASL
ncbi:MAG: putative diheme cytochrome c-553 [Myxococcaceae bacterium]|nr:putative diheme cytochrome c-553 [Myxococcaceae bacterium]